MQLWLVSRHGTRYPSYEKIEELKGLNRFKYMITADTTMCPEDVRAIRDWNPLNLTKDDHYMLQRQGIEELKSLAARLKRQLPQLFNTAYDDTKFKVRIVCPPTVFQGENRHRIESVRLSQNRVFILSNRLIC